jgi:hypothetical protein
MENDKVERYTGCTATIDLSNKTLTVTQHSTKEQINEQIIAKYAGIFTVEPDGEYDGIVAYDSEYDVYVVFVNDDEGWKYYGHAKVEDPSVLEGMPIATVNTTTKVISFT